MFLRRVFSRKDSTSSSSTKNSILSAPVVGSLSNDPVESITDEDTITAQRRWKFPQRSWSDEKRGLSVLQLTPLWEHIIRTQSLPEKLNVSEMFEEFLERLRDPEWQVRQHALRVLVDVLIVMRDTADSQFSPLVGPLVRNIGHAAPAVRKGALDALRVYMSNTAMPETILLEIIDIGMEQRGANSGPFDGRLCVGVMLSLPALVQATLNTPKRTYILRSAISALANKMVQVTYQEVALKVLLRIQTMIGVREFSEYINHGAYREFELLCNVYGLPDKNDKKDKSDDDSETDITMSTEYNISWSSSPDGKIKPSDLRWCSSMEIDNNCNGVPCGKPKELFQKIITQDDFLGESIHKDQKVIMETEIKINQDTAVTMRLMEDDTSQDNPSETSDNDNEDNLDNGRNNNTPKQVPIDFQVLSESEVEEINKNHIEDEVLRRTPRRVTFGGEIVKIRTPDSDSVDQSDVDERRTQRNGSESQINSPQSSSASSPEPQENKQSAIVNVEPVTIETNPVNSKPLSAGARPKSSLKERTVPEPASEINLGVGKMQHSPPIKLLPDINHLKLPDENVIGVKPFGSTLSAFRSTSLDSTVEPTNSVRNNMREFRFHGGDAIENISYDINPSELPEIHPEPNKRNSNSFQLQDDFKRPIAFHIPATIIQPKQFNAFQVQGPETRIHSPVSSPDHDHTNERPTKTSSSTPSSPSKGRFRRLSISSVDKIISPRSFHKEVEVLHNLQMASTSPTRSRNNSMVWDIDVTATPLTKMEEPTQVVSTPTTTAQRPQSSHSSSDQQLAPPPPSFADVAPSRPPQLRHLREEQVQTSFSIDQPPEEARTWEQLGLVSNEVLHNLKSGDWRLRSEAFCIIEKVLKSSENLALVQPYLDTLLRTLLSSEKNSGVCEHKRRIVTNLISRLPLDNLENRTTQIVIGLCRQGGSGSNRVAKALMQRLPPTAIVLKLLSEEFLSARSSRFRENALQMVLYALMTFPSTYFDISMCVGKATYAATDNKKRVRQAALDVIAVLGQISSPKAVMDVVSQMSINRLDRDNLTAAIKARLSRKQLPIVSNDGTVEYALRIPSPHAKQNAFLFGADVEWISAGVGSVSPTSLKKRSQKHQTNGVLYDDLNRVTMEGSRSTKPPHEILAVGVGVRPNYEHINSMAGLNNLTRIPIQQLEDSRNTQYIVATTVPVQNGGGIRSKKQQSRSFPELAAMSHNPTSSLNGLKVVKPLTSRFPAMENKAFRNGNLEQLSFSSSYNAVQSRQNAAPKAYQPNPNVSIRNGFHSSYTNGTRFGHNLSDEIEGNRPFTHPPAVQSESSANQKRFVNVERDILSRTTSDSQEGRKSSTLYIEDKPPHTPTGNHYESHATTPILRQTPSKISQPASAISRTVDQNHQTDNHYHANDNTVVDNGGESSAEDRSSTESANSTPTRVLGASDPSSIYEIEKEENLLQQKSAPISRPQSSISAFISSDEVKSLKSGERPKTAASNSARSAAPTPVQEVIVLDEGDTESAVYENTTESRPQSTSESRPQSRPQSTVQSRPQSTVQSRPQSIVQSRPQSTVMQSRPQSAAPSRSESPIDSRPSTQMEMHSDSSRLETSRPQTRMQSRPGSHIGSRHNSRPQSSVYVLPDSEELSTDDRTAESDSVDDDAPHRLSNEVIDASSPQNLQDEISTTPFEEIIELKQIGDDVDTRSNSSSGTLGSDRPQSFTTDNVDNAAPFVNGRPAPLVRRTALKRSRPPILFRSRKVTPIKPLMTKQKSTELFSSNLRRLDRPREGLSNCLSQLESVNWETTMSGLQLFVQLIRNHPEMVENQIHLLSIALAKHVKNLRSQVSRAACQATGEFFVTHRKSLDQDADDLASALLSRSADTNKFLRADATRALETMCDNLTTQKVIHIITTRGVSHPNALVRTTTAKLMNRLVTRVGCERVFSMNKDQRDKIILTGASLLGEGSLETRNYAKLIFQNLSEHPSYGKTIFDVIPARVYRNIEKTLKTIA